MRPLATLARVSLLGALLAPVVPGSGWAGTAPMTEGRRPELVFQAGRTFAVGSKVSDAYDQGGFTVTAGALWPWEDRFRFGVVLFAADLGDQVLPVTLADPSGGPAKDYGSIDFGHRGSWGASWRVDATGPRLGHVGRGYATATYGYYRFVQDHLGHRQGALSAVGGSVGVGVERVLTSHHTLGLTAGGDWMSDDFTRHFAHAALEWRWRW